MLLRLAQLLMMKIRVGDGWTMVCNKKRHDKKRLNGKNDFGKRGFFNYGKEKRSEKEGKREEFCKQSKEANFQEDRSLRSGPKLLSQKKTPVFVVSSGSQPVKSGCGVSGPIFDRDVFVSGALFSVDGRSTLPGSENDTSMNQYLKDLEEELVLGDTPPQPFPFLQGPVRSL